MANPSAFQFAFAAIVNAYDDLIAYVGNAENNIYDELGINNSVSIMPIIKVIGRAIKNCGRFCGFKVEIDKDTLIITTSLEDE